MQPLPASRMTDGSARLDTPSVAFDVSSAHFRALTCHHRRTICSARLPAPSTVAALRVGLAAEGACSSAPPTKRNKLV